MTKRVLIVEDDRDIREPMRELLEGEGFEVSCATSSEEALQMIEHEPTHGAILCDLMMPVMSGVDLVKKLKVQNQKAADSVVILSAASNGRETASELGVGFLSKPIDINALLTTLNNYCT